MTNDAEELAAHQHILIDQRRGGACCPSTYLLRPRRLNFVDQMTTIDHLNDDIRALLDKNVGLEMQLIELKSQRNDELSVEKKQELADDIKSIRTKINGNDELIITKEKQILADKQKEAADKQKEASKERQIAADKEYRLKRGEITDSPIKYVTFVDKITLRLLLHPS